MVKTKGGLVGKAIKSCMFDDRFVTFGDAILQ